MYLSTNLQRSLIALKSHSFVAQKTADLMEAIKASSVSLGGQSEGQESTYVTQNSKWHMKV